MKEYCYLVFHLFVIFTLASIMCVNLYVKYVVGLLAFLYLKTKIEQI